MFKLIASDMDGTLLDENGQVPPETYELILALHEHGVHFAASSGRRYDRLCEFFAPVRDKMDFVAANGAPGLRRRQNGRPRGVFAPGDSKARPSRQDVSQSASCAL